MAVPALLQAMVQKVLDGQRDVKQRLGTPEQGQATVIKQLGSLAETGARLQARMDRMSGRRERRHSQASGSRPVPPETFHDKP